MTNLETTNLEITNVETKDVEKTFLEVTLKHWNDVKITNIEKYNRSDNLNRYTVHMHYAVPQNKSTQEGLVLKCVEYSLKENKHFAIHKSTSQHSYILKSGATDENSNNSNNNTQENWQVRISIKYARTKSSDANYWQSHAVQSGV